MTVFFFSASIFACFVFLASALEVSPNSPCAKRCIDDPAKGNVSANWDSLTNNTMISCLDWEFAGNNATDVGKKFKDCQDCQKWSAYAAPNLKYAESDALWFVYNNRVTIDWCLFGRITTKETNANVSSTYPYEQCRDQCALIEGASDYIIKAVPQRWDWCEYNGNYKANAQQCTSCLYNATGLTILGNIVSTLGALCDIKPTVQINMTADIYTASRLQLSASSTSSPSTAPSASSTTSPKSGSSLSAGAIAGVVLGTLVFVALFLSGILLVLRLMRRREKARNAEKAYEVHGDDLVGKTTYAHHRPVEVQAYNDPVEIGGRAVVQELDPRSPSGAT